MKENCLHASQPTPVHLIITFKQATEHLILINR